MIDRYQEGIKGPLLYTDTETLDGRQSLFDANDMVYNTLDKDVQEISYLACALGHATPYPFGGGEAVSWSSAPLLIIMEDASHTPVPSMSLLMGQRLAMSKRRTSAKSSF